MNDFIRLENIVKKFYVGQPNELEILHGINLTVNEGEFLSIVGPSGSGKSTLINYLMTQFDCLEFSISATSRSPRGEEKNGVEIQNQLL